MYALLQENGLEKADMEMIDYRNCDTRDIGASGTHVTLGPGAETEAHSKHMRGGDIEDNLVR